MQRSIRKWNIHIVYLIVTFIFLLENAKKCNGAEAVKKITITKGESFPTSINLSWSMSTSSPSSPSSLSSSYFFVLFCPNVMYRYASHNSSGECYYLIPGVKYLVSVVAYANESQTHVVGIGTATVTTQLDSVKPKVVDANETCSKIAWQPFVTPSVNYKVKCPQQQQQEQVTSDTEIWCCHISNSENRMASIAAYNAEFRQSRDAKINLSTTLPAPSKLNFTSTPTSVKVTWQSVNTSGIQYRVLCPTGDKLETREDTTPKNYYECKGLISGESYSIQVTCAPGSAAASKSFLQSRPRTILTRTRLEQPDATLFSVNETCAEVNWSVKMRNVSFRVSCPFGTRDVSVVETRAVCCGLSASSVHSIGVATARQDWADSEMKRIEVRTRAAKPMNLRVTAEDKSAQIVWDLVSTSNVTYSVTCGSHRDTTVTNRFDCSPLEPMSVYTATVVTKKDGFPDSEPATLEFRTRISQPSVSILNVTDSCINVLITKTSDSKEMAFEVICPNSDWKMTSFKQSVFVQCYHLKPARTYNVSVVAYFKEFEQSRPVTVTANTKLPEPSGFFSDAAEDCVYISWIFPIFSISGVTFNVTCSSTATPFTVSMLEATCCQLMEDQQTVSVIAIKKGFESMGAAETVIQGRLKAPVVNSSPVNSSCIKLIWKSNTTVANVSYQVKCRKASHFVLGSQALCCQLRDAAQHWVSVTATKRGAVDSRTVTVIEQTKVKSPELIVQSHNVTCFKVTWKQPAKDNRNIVYQVNCTQNSLKSHEQSMLQKKWIFCCNLTPATDYRVLAVAKFQKFPHSDLALAVGKTQLPIPENVTDTVLTDDCVKLSWSVRQSDRVLGIDYVVNCEKGRVFNKSASNAICCNFGPSGSVHKLLVTAVKPGFNSSESVEKFVELKGQAYSHRLKILLGLTPIIGIVCIFGVLKLLTSAGKKDLPGK